MSRREDLYITVPSFFKCPISLDVMRSPVSLSTGVTYDRSSIQRWLESGSNTCPATMQILPSKDFVPNHTLHHLIQIWSSTRLEPEPESEHELQSLSSHQALHLITQLISGSHNNNNNRFESFIKILRFASESQENRRLIESNHAFVNLLLRLVGGGTETGTDTQTSTITKTENDNSPKLKGVFGCWNVLKYPKVNVSETTSTSIQVDLSAGQVASPIVTKDATTIKSTHAFGSIRHNIHPKTSTENFKCLKFPCIIADPNPDLLEAGLKLLQIISPKVTAVTILITHPGFLSSLARILRTGRSDAKVAVSCILQTISPDTESKKAVFGNNGLLSELIQILKSHSKCINPVIAESILSTIVFLSSPRANKLTLIRAGVVPIMADIIRPIKSDTKLTTELALTLLEMLAGSAEGRAAIGGDTNCLHRVVQKLTKGSKSANEHGVALLWSLCYLFRDQKAKEAVMRSDCGLTKILMLMQSDCSPSVKRMCCDLLRIFSVNSKSSLASYDSKTTHIMPC